MGVIHRILEWLCCFDEFEGHGYSGIVYRHKIVKIKAWNWYLVDCVTRDGRAFGRMGVSPVWNWVRVKHLLGRKVC